MCTSDKGKDSIQGLCVKQTASRKLLQHTGSSLGAVMRETARWGEEGRSEREGHVYTHTAGSPHCTAETNVIVKQLHSNKTILNIKKKTKTRRKMCQEPKRHFTKEKNARNLILMKSKYMKVKPRDTLLNCQRQSLKARPPNSLSEVYTYIALPLCSRLCSCLSKGINHPTNCGKFLKRWENQTTLSAS